jgi:transposase-like protein
MPRRQNHDTAYDWLMDAIVKMTPDPSKDWREFPCVDWPYSTNQNGYGHFNLEGKTTRATRFVYNHFNGVLADEMMACHYCDRPLCIEINHLFEGDHEKNMEDMVEKGRGRNRSREEHNLAKLNWEKVAIARKMYADGATMMQVAQHFGLAFSTTRSMLIGETWAPEGERKVKIITGRRKGDQNKGSKLNWEKASLVRKWFAEGQTMNWIARQLGVNSGTIHGIVHGRTWRVEDEPPPET